MSFSAGLRHALDLRQSDVISELKGGDSLETILDRHLLAVEGMSDRQILTSVLLVSPDGKRLTHGAAPSLPRSYVEAINGSEIGPSSGSCGTAAYFGRAVYVTDIATDPLWADYRDLALEHGLQACWSTPIRHADGHVMGTFAIYHRRLTGPTRNELIAIDIITDNVAEAITWANDKGSAPRQHQTHVPPRRNSNVAVCEVLPRQVAALQAISATISQLAFCLDSTGQEAIDAILSDSEKLAECVRRHAAEPEGSEV
jgi:hypothetical protein